MKASCAFGFIEYLFSLSIYDDGIPQFPPFEINWDSSFPIK
jgi:hypothetical protein